MQNRYIVTTLLLLLVVLIIILSFASSQQRKASEIIMNTDETYNYDADPVNGLNIYTYGKTLDGAMIPFQGGPVWLMREEAGCAICHGENGRGGIDVEGVEVSPPNIAKLTREGGSLSFDEFADIVRMGVYKKGKPLSTDMPRYSMPDNYLHDLYDYVQGF